MSNRIGQPFIWVGLTAALVVVAIVALSLFDGSSLPGDAEAVDASPPPVAVTPRPIPQAPPSPTERADAAGSDLSAQPRPAAERKRRALEIYRDQVDEDRAQLGSEFTELDRLWKKGRYGGGSKGASDALEELVRRYGDTHHAVCARYMLAKHDLLKGAGKRADRQQRSASKLETLVDTESESRCDSGARATNLAKFFLATQIYRHEDWDRSVEMLEELTEIDSDEVDGLDVPISLRARGILSEVDEMER